MTEPTITVALTRGEVEAAREWLGSTTIEAFRELTDVDASADRKLRAALDSPQPERYTVEARASLEQLIGLVEDHRECMESRGNEGDRAIWKAADKARAALSAAFPDQPTDTASQHDALSVDDQFPDQQPVEDCCSCGEPACDGQRCPNSKRACGHHCNCSWVHDHCHWCGKDFGDQPEQEGEAGCGWCHGEGAITDPSGRLGADCPRCEGRTWLLCERPNHPLHDPQEGEAGDWPGVCDADQSFNEWELGCIRTFAARQLDALSPPEAESVVGERWLAFLNKAAHAAHRLASADPAPAQHPTGLSEGDRERLENIALNLLERGYHEPAAEQAAFLRKLADQQGRD